MAADSSTPLFAARDDRGLTADQIAAIEHHDGPLVVLAGPGAGKTRVIIERVASMIRRGVNPSSIVAISFTTRAAGELRQRLNALVGPAATDQIQATTFHALGLGLLARFGDQSGLRHPPTILDSALTRRMLREILREHPAPDVDLTLGQEPLIDHAIAAFQEFHHRSLTPERVEGIAASWAERITSNPVRLEASDLAAERAKLGRFQTLLGMYREFEARSRQRGVLTLDHLITRPIALLSQRRAIADIVRSEWQHFVVDEFQDMNLAQIELLRLLAPPARHPDLCVVGDDDQAIYGFRGADDRAFYRFASIWSSHRRIMLSDNFRSARSIIAVSNAIITRAEDRFEQGKQIKYPSGRGSGSEPADAGVDCVELDADFDDAEAIARMILIDRAAFQRPWDAYAVVARTHGDLDRIGQALMLEGVPVVRSRPPTPRDDAGVQDLLAWIDVLIDPTFAWPARRLLARPPFSVSAEQLVQWQRAHASWLASRSVDADERQARGTGSVDTESGFVYWLGRHAQAHPAVKRFSALHASLLKACHAEPADDAVLTIITRANLVHADLPAERDRAARIAALVAVLRFTRSRLDRLEPPGDLAAWRRYVEDLNEQEKQFRDVTIEPVEDDQELDGIGVRLVTAHASKGLQFETVFVPRVSPAQGYGKAQSTNDPVIPEWAEDRAGDTRSVRDRNAAEARRLFYVACTRAQSRLVLLAKKNKSPSKSTHYFEELTLDPAGKKLVSTLELEVWRQRALEAGIQLASARGAMEFDPAAESSGAATRSQFADRLRHQIRAEAAQALDACDRVGSTEQETQSCADVLTSTAKKMSVVAALEHGDAIPSWAASSPALKPFVDSARRLLGTAVTTSRPRLVPQPPLSLSYTSLRDYDICPGCYYIKHVLGLPDGIRSDAIVGITVHETLEQYYKRWRARDSEGLFGSETEGLRATESNPTDEVLRIARDVLDRSMRAGAMVSEAHRQRINVLLRETIRNFHDERVNILEIERRFTFPYSHAGHTHTFEAKIDRIDLLGDGSLRLVDYKTGEDSQALVEPKADDLQMGVYWLALKHAMNMDPSRSRGEYWMLASGQRGVLAFDRLKVDAVQRKINKVIDGILAGEFKPDPDHKDEPCSWLRDPLYPSVQ